MPEDNNDTIRDQQIFELVRLAVNCKFITEHKEKEILALIPEYLKKNHEPLPACFFLENNILSKKKVELLSFIKNHLDILMADKKFGKIGVANELVSQKKVQEALDMQVAIFRKEKKSVKIGDILVKNKDISVADQKAILMTQNRMRKDFLSSEFNMINIQEDIICDTDKADSILKVEGDIVPGVKVLCHQLNIKGDILGNVRASGNIDVIGNIGQKAEKQDLLKNPVYVNTQGSLRVSHEIINAQIVAMQGLKAQNADLVSSQVFSSRDLVVKNIFSSPDAPSILRIVRENYGRIQKMTQLIKKKRGILDKMSHKKERDQLTKELMEQVQVQNGIWEKLNVLLYLKNIVDDPDLKDIDDMVKKVELSEKQNKSIPRKKNLSIPENTRAHKFMKIILGKIKNKILEDQRKYIREWYDNISFKYKNILDITDKMNLEYEIKNKEIEDETKKLIPEINEKEREIKKLVNQKNALLAEQKKIAALKNPMIKIKNQVQKHTIIQGENAELVIEQSIYGVSIREDYTSPAKGSKMIVEGYFQ